MRVKTEPQTEPQNNTCATIAIDFGTTYSGIAYRLRAKTEDCTIVAAAPGENQSYRAPTSVLLNDQNEAVEFGLDAERKYNAQFESGGTITEELSLFQRFKMCLYEPQYDEPTVLSAGGRRELSLQVVVVAALKYLKSFALELVEKQTGEALLVSDVQWVLTIPAIWSHSAKQFMRQATLRAGLYLRGNEGQLKLALEPEAAAISLSQKFRGILDENSKFMVLDCGGGTVDITAYGVESADPLTFKELAPPSGGDWGGTNVDAAFETFPTNLIGKNTFTAFKHRQVTHYHELMDRFIQDKENNRLSTIDLSALIDFDGKIDFYYLTGRYVNDHPDTPVECQTFSRIKLSPKLAESFFQPSIDSIIQHVSGLLKQPSYEGITRILMVGGYSACKVLEKQVRQKFGHSLKIITPDNAAAAIVIGGVLFGEDEKSVIQSRIAPLAYGLRCCHVRRFREHQAEYHVWDEEQGIYMVPDVFSCFVEKGKSIPVGHSITRDFHPVDPNDTELSNDIMSSSDEHTPRYTTHPSVRKIGAITLPINPAFDRNYMKVKFEFGRTELIVTAKDPRTGISQRVDLHLPLTSSASF